MKLVSGASKALPGVSLRLRDIIHHPLGGIIFMFSSKNSNYKTETQTIYENMEEQYNEKYGYRQSTAAVLLGR